MKKALSLFVAVLIAVPCFIGAGTAPEGGDYKSFIRLEPFGPPDKGMTGDEKEKEHVYYTSDKNELVSAGVWQAAPHTIDPVTPKYSEFMLILEGSVTLIDKEGREEILKAGDAVLVPRGVERTWKQTEPIRKYWVIFDLAEAVTSEEKDRPKSFIRFDPSVELKGEGGTKGHRYYEARGKKVATGVWEAQPPTSPESDFYTPKYTEAMFILEGSVTLEDKSGREETFKAGDAVITPKGVPIKWKQTEYVKKYWVIFDPVESET